MKSFLMGLLFIWAMTWGEEVAAGDQHEGRLDAFYTGI